MSFVSVSITGKVNFVSELNGGANGNKGVTFGIGIQKTVSMAKCPIAKPMSNNPEMGIAYVTITCNAWGYNGNNKIVDYLMKNLDKGVWVSIKNADLDLDPMTGGAGIYTGSDGQPRSRIRVTINSLRDIEIINPKGQYNKNENGAQAQKPQQAQPMMEEQPPMPPADEYGYGPADDLDLEIPF